MPSSWSLCETVSVQRLPHARDRSLPIAFRFLSMLPPAFAMFLHLPSATIATAAKGIPDAVYAAVTSKLDF
jgi:hypothetical protein